MARHLSAVVLMLCLGHGWAFAQENAITITAASANVHKSPTSSSPVIGHANKGQALEVTRDVGDWVKIAWPSDPSGVGYVRQSLGSRGPAAKTSTASVGTRATNSPQPLAAEPLGRASATDRQPTVVTRQRSAQPSTYVARPSHVVGVGGRMQGPSLGIGASLRAWSPGWLGLQLDISRYAVTVPFDTNRMTSIQFAPSVLFTPTDMTTDYVWIRPYAGAGLSLYRSTLTTPVVGVTTSDSQVGFQAFGGAEFTAASLPAFGISVDLGYRRFTTPFAGFELGGSSIGIAGHWYVK